MIAQAGAPATVAAPAAKSSFTNGVPLVVIVAAVVVVIAIIAIVIVSRRKPRTNG